MKQNNDGKTLEYYEKNAEAFADNTLYVDFGQTQERFLKNLPENARILDFGCGAGRDAKYFLEKGFRVDAWDGSAQLCRIASAYTGMEVQNKLFQELDSLEEYDGIWACSSILHLPRRELSYVLQKIEKALKPEGILYTSFKYGSFEGIRNGRYFTDFTLETFSAFLKEINGMVIEDDWITGDVRPDRREEKWLNLILRKKQK